MANPLYAANRVLEELAIHEPEDLNLLELIAWERGALVRQLPIEGAEARIAIVGQRAVITISTAIADPRRKRFSIAHELGHFEMHRRDNLLRLCLSEDISDWEIKQAGINLEREANEFAAALLLPERFFAPLCKDKEPSLDYIAEIADTFNVSLTVAALRYLEFCDEPVCIVFSQSGHIKWFRGSKDFEEIREDAGIFIDVRSRLDPTSYADRFFRVGSIPIGQKRVRASIWFTSGNYRSDATIQEQSIAMPTYDAVLTLLWIDDDIEEEDDF